MPELSKLTKKLLQVRSSLKELQKGIKGEVVISEAQEEYPNAICLTVQQVLGHGTGPEVCASTTY